MATYDLEQTVALMERLRLLPVHPCPARHPVRPAPWRILALRWDDVKWDSEAFSVAQSAETDQPFGIRYRKPVGTRPQRPPVGNRAAGVESMAGKGRPEFLRIGIRPNGQTFIVTKADGSPVNPRNLAGMDAPCFTRRTTADSFPRSAP